MSKLSIDKVTRRIEELEYSTYHHLVVTILVERVRINLDGALADVSLDFGDGKEYIPDCEYPIKYFEDCYEDSTDVTEVDPKITAGYARIMPLLLDALDFALTSTEVFTISKHMDRVALCLSEPPLPSKELTVYLKDAESYLNTLSLYSV